MPALKFKVLSKTFDAFYSDFDFPLEAEVGMDPKNPQNVAYIKYGKPYAQFQGLGGVSLKIPAGLLPVSIQANDVLNVYIDNTTTGNALSSFAYSHIFQSFSGVVTQSPRVIVGVQDLQKLAPGIIDIGGSFKSISANTVYVFQSLSKTITSP